MKRKLRLSDIRLIYAINHNTSPDFTLRLLKGSFLIRHGLLFLILCSVLQSSIFASINPQLTTTEKLARKVIIRRDNYGVPHVFGPNDASCVFGFLYAQAEDNFWQVEDNYIRALGRSAEVHGESTLPSDLLNRLLEIPARSKAEYERMSPRLKEICNAAADGLNHFLASNPDVRPRLLNRFEPWYVLAFYRYIVYQSFILGQSGLDMDELRKAVREQKPSLPIGSNAWAVAPSKSASGRAMLFINPHLPLFGAMQLYEGHLNSGEGWNIYGATFFGSPFPTLGHNERIGWTHTVNEPDIADIYIEEFDDPQNPLAYSYDGGHKAAVEWSDTISVKREGIEATTFTFRKSHHGPIISINGNKALAVKIARLDENGPLDQWYAMSKSRSLTEFKTAMSRLAIPFFNTLYADQDGNIFYVYNGAIPKRSTRFDWTSPVEGKNPETEWQGYHSFEELPQMLNPKSGFLQSCNQTPFATTTGENPEKSKYPDYMSREADNARAKNSRRILSKANKFTFDALCRAAFDTTVIEAETQIPDLLSELEKLKQEDPKRVEKLNEQILLLTKWNRTSTIESVEMSLFTLWTEQVFTMTMMGDDQPWVKVRAFENVIAGLTSSFGGWRVAWGEINRLQRTHTSGNEQFSDSKPSLPIAGGPGWVGTIFTFYTKPEEGQKRRYGILGPSYMSVVEFTSKVRASSVHIFGENADQKSAHYFDQAQLLASKQFKPVLFLTAEVKAKARKVYSPGIKSQAQRKAA